MRLVAPCVVLLAGCDSLFNLDHIKDSNDDAAMRDAAADDGAQPDAPPPPLCAMFDGRQPLQNNMTGSHDPTLSHDRLELFFVRHPGTNYDLYRATRADTMTQFGAGNAVAELNETFDDADPALTHDGLMIVFKSNRGGIGYRAYQATRTQVGAAFTNPIPVPGLESQLVLGIDLSPDGLTVYFYDGTMLVQGKRTTRADPVGNPTVLGSFGSFPSMSPTRLAVYYDGAGGLVRRTRASEAEMFGPMEQVVDAGASDGDMISDGTAIVFTIGTSSDVVSMRECL